MLGRMYGLASDQILSLDLVDADGNIITANANNNSDLLFASQGASQTQKHINGHLTDKIDNVVKISHDLGVTHVWFIQRFHVRSECAHQNCCPCFLPCCLHAPRKADVGRQADTCCQYSQYVTAMACHHSVSPSAPRLKPTSYNASVT